MVSAIKKWLGIDALKRENLVLAKALKVHTDRLDVLEEDARQTLSIVLETRKSLTPEPIEQKIIAKPAGPKRVNWGQARAALERASEPQEQI